MPDIGLATPLTTAEWALLQSPACGAPPACQLLQGNVEWAHNTVQLTAGHTGRVAALAFSPFLSDALLVVGDSGFTVWRVPASSTSGRERQRLQLGKRMSRGRTAALPLRRATWHWSSSGESGCWGRRRQQQRAAEPPAGPCSLHPWPPPEAADNAPNRRPSM